MDPDDKSPYDIAGEGKFFFCGCLQAVFIDFGFLSFFFLELTLSAITKRLTEEEAQLVKQKTTNIIPGRHSFLLLGISIEADQ